MGFVLPGIFAAFRIIICFYVLFGILGPLLLPETNRRSGIERLLFSFIGFGGLIIVDVFVLSMLNLYDFISLFFSIIFIPLIAFIIKELRRGGKLDEIVFSLEKRILRKQVAYLESLKANLRGLLSKSSDFINFRFSDNLPQFLAFLIAIGAGIVRMIPAIVNPAPFTRYWYSEVDDVKELDLQNYFGELPEPTGLEVLIDVFSTISQVTPELLLHISGALISFFLALIIYWLTEVILDRKNKMASLLAASIYAFVPTLLSPLVLDMEVEAGSLELALCFALPTIFIYLSDIRRDRFTHSYYIVMGILSTALINLFVFMMILVPFLFLGLFTLPGSFIIKKFSRALGILLATVAIALTPYVGYCLINNIDVTGFFRQQLFNTQVFSFYPDLITDLDLLSLIYLGIALLLIFIILFRIYLSKERLHRELVFLFYFILTSFIFTPYFAYSYIIIDPDQLGVMYAIMIAIFIGIVFNQFTDIFRAFISRREKLLRNMKIASAGLLLLTFIILQGGISVSPVLPQTLPNGFFEAYYKITDERLPYTYATVSPEIDRTLAKNRHFFMNYEYFLDNYTGIDSAYSDYLSVPEIDRVELTVPPASVFIFIEKPPYTHIQKGILFNSASVMNDMEQWVENYQKVKGERIKLYYESDDAVVYEIINRENESEITDLLLNVHPTGKREVEDEVN